MEHLPRGMVSGAREAAVLLWIHDGAQIGVVNGQLVSGSIITLTFAPRVQLADGRTVDITERPTRLGRLGGDFSGPHVSREQCQLQLVGGCVKLKSLGMNATLVFPPKDPGVTEHSGALAERDGIHQVRERLQSCSG